MTTSEERRRLLEHLESKEFRDALVHADLANRILFQMKAMLEDRGWTQEKLAAKAGTAQPVISKYLKGYENFSINTLEKLASALDVSFTAGFEPFSDLAERHLNVDWASLAIPDYPNDAALRAPVFEYSLASSATVPGSFLTASFITTTTPKLPAEQLDLGVEWMAIGRHDIPVERWLRSNWPFETKTRQQIEESAYVNAA